MLKSGMSSRQSHKCMASPTPLNISRCFQRRANLPVRAFYSSVRSHTGQTVQDVNLSRRLGAHFAGAAVDKPRKSTRLSAATPGGFDPPSSRDAEDEPPETGPGSNDTQQQTAPLPSRLVTLIRSIPDRLRLYFRRRPLRQWMWIVICYGLGHYTANSTTLAFGALAVNDVVAGACCVFLVEIVTFLFYRSKNPAFYLTLLNSFKLGFTAALMSDAMKLGGIIIGG